MLLNILLKQREHYLLNFKRFLIYYQEEVAGHLKHGPKVSKVLVFEIYPQNY